MRIVLDKLTLSNFKGIKDLEIDFKGKNANISGQNATGKTSIVDAFSWLLTDKDSTDKKDFQIKTLDENGQPLHGVEHSVTAVLDVSGKRIELKKSYYEKWTKQKGSAEKTFTGHTTDYFIDGVPCSKKADFTEKINSIIDEETLKLLTNPLYFNDLHWKKKRDLLFEVSGQVSDTDVIDKMATLDNKDDISILTNILNTRSIDDHKAVIGAKRKKVNEQLQKIPVRIDEVVKGKPDLKEINFGMVRRNLEKHQDENEKLRNSIIQLQNSGGVADKERRIAEIDNEMYKLLSESNRTQDEVVRALEDDLYNTVHNLSRAEQRKTDGEEYIQTKEKSIEELNKGLIQSKEDFFAERDKPFEILQDSVCPTCKQDLPEEQLEEARKTAEDQFNLQKSKKLESINSAGKRAKAMLEKDQKDLEKAKEELQKIEDIIKGLKEEKQTIETKLKQAKETLVDVEQNTEYKVLTDEKTKLKDAILSIKNNAQEEVEKVKQTIKGNEEAMKTMQSTLAKEEQSKQADARIEQLKAEERDLATEYAQLEKEMYLIEEFTRAKVSLVDELINNKFNIVRFKMFNELVNGGLEDTCETLVNSNGSWVPWADANSAGRINAGLDIIKALQEHYDILAPIWMDNAESINRHIPMYSQIVKLFVTEDEKLKVEVSA